MNRMGAFIAPVDGKFPISKTLRSTLVKRPTYLTVTMALLTLGAINSAAAVAETLTNGMDVSMAAFSAKLKAANLTLVSASEAYGDDAIKATIDKTLGKFRSNIYLPFVEASLSGNSQNQSGGNVAIDQLRVQSAKADYGTWISELEKECLTPCAQANPAAPQTCPSKKLAAQLQGDLDDKIKSALAKEPKMDLEAKEAIEEATVPSKVGDAIIRFCSGAIAKDKQRIVSFIASHS